MTAPGSLPIDGVLFGETEEYYEITVRRQLDELAEHVGAAQRALAVIGSEGLVTRKLAFVLRDALDEAEFAAQEMCGALDPDFEVRQ